MFDKKEKTFHGIAVSSGVAIGIPYFYVHEVLKVTKKSILGNEIKEELKKYEDALYNTRKNILTDKLRAKKQSGSSAASIFDAHILIVEDEILIKEIKEFIVTNNLSASYSLTKIMNDYKIKFENMQNEYFSQRAFDIEDVSNRISRELRYFDQEKEKINLLDEKRIIVADNIFPSDMMNFNSHNILGFVTERGGKTSHATIMAHSLEVPAVIGIKDCMKKLKDASIVIIDGDEGKVIINPSTATFESYKKKEFELNKRFLENLEISKLESITTDGTLIHIASNMQTIDELDNVLKFNSKGIGLFRSEFVFEEKIGLLTEDEQEDIYTEISKRIIPNNVIIRLLDIGGDKIFGKIKLKEDNPFLGLRGIRLLFKYHDILISHIRAIIKSSVHKKNIWIMIPFLTDIEEMKKIIKIIRKEEQKLKLEGIDIKSNIKIGTMLEIPSAILMIKNLVKIVDFFSIGTNDLTQYTLAADRGNRYVSYIYDSLHPSVLKLIKTAISVSVKNNKYIGLCGEMGGNPLVVPLLLGMGLRNISVSPFLIPTVKKVVRKINIPECQDLAKKVLSLDSTKKVYAVLQKFFKNKMHT